MYRRRHRSSRESPAGHLEFPHGIQGFARRSFRGPLPARDSLRERRTGLRTRPGIARVPFLGRRSPYRPRPYRRCHLALLHRLPGSDLLGCGLSSRQVSGAPLPGAASWARAWGAATWGAPLGSATWARLVARLLGAPCPWLPTSGAPRHWLRIRGEAPGLVVSRDVKLCGTEICGANSWGSEAGAWRTAAPRAQVRSPPAGLPSKAGPLPVQAGPRPGRHSQSGGPGGPGQAALGTVPIEVQPALLRAGGGRRLGNVGLREQRPINGQEQGRHTNGDHASECDQGGGDDETQMRVQGPSPSGRPRASPIPGKIGARRDYVRLGGRLPAEIETVFNASRPLGPGRKSKTRAQRENPPLWPEFRQRPTRRRFAKHREVRSIGSQQRRMAVDI